MAPATPRLEAVKHCALARAIKPLNVATKSKNVMCEVLIIKLHQTLEVKLLAIVIRIAEIHSKAEEIGRASCRERV